MEKLKSQLCELLWKEKCCIIHKNNNRDHELHILDKKIIQQPYLLRCLIYILKQKLKQYQFNCILSTDNKCSSINSILGYEIGIPIYSSQYEIKDLCPLIINFSIHKYPKTNNDYTTFTIFNMIPLKIKDSSDNLHSLLHVYELLDYGYRLKYLQNTEWELTQMYYYDKIPFEYRAISKKNIQNRNLAITQCYNLLFKKKTNLILDCSGLDAITILKTIAIYGDYFFIVIIDTDCFPTFTKKHRECFISCCKEKSLLIYDRLRIEKLGETQLNKIISKKIGKLNWLQGFFLYSFSSNILDFFNNHYPTLGIFFENYEIEQQEIVYTELQKNITQVIGITLEDKRKECHTDSRIFYTKKNNISLQKLTEKSLTHLILFDNYDFLTLHTEQINLESLKEIRKKCWSLFKNKF